MSSAPPLRAPRRSSFVVRIDQDGEGNLSGVIERVRNRGEGIISRPRSDRRLARPHAGGGGRDAAGPAARTAAGPVKSALFEEDNNMTTWWTRTKVMVRSLIAVGGLLAMPMTAHASGPFDINTLPVDEENRFSNVGAFIVAVVDDDGNPVGRVAHSAAC
jgi:hypothetical protein